MIIISLPLLLIPLQKILMMIIRVCSIFYHLFPQSFHIFSVIFFFHFFCAGREVSVVAILERQNFVRVQKDVFKVFSFFWVITYNLNSLAILLNYYTLVINFCIKELSFQLNSMCHQILLWDTHPSLTEMNVDDHVVREF